MSQAHVHASHPAIVKRLKRAGGHLASVIAMMEAGRSCLDIAQQLAAVESAVAEAKRALIRDHVDHCLTAAAGPMTAQQQQSFAELQAITRYL